MFLDPHQLGTCLSELGLVLMQAKQIPRAMEHFEQGEQVLLAAEDVHALATLRYRMGLLLSLPEEGETIANGDNAELALEKIFLSLEAAEKYGSKILIACCIQAEGVIWVRRGDNQKGVKKMRLVFLSCTVSSLALRPFPCPRPSLTLLLLLSACCLPCPHTI